MNKQKNYFLNLLKKLNKIPNYLVIFMIEVYRVTLSPSVGILRFLPFYPRPSCIFYPSCSEYAKISFKKYTFIKAFYKSVHRIGRCNPFNTPDIDLP